MFLSKPESVYFESKFVVRLEKIVLKPGQKVYFASDFHLGTPDGKVSLLREQKIIHWINEIKGDAAAIIFNGDVFDFWFEYKFTIPKGFIRFQGKLAELADLGIKLYFFTGNHDLWMFGYYEKEFGATVSRKPLKFEINDKKFYVVHGDGCGPGDHTHKMILKIFESRFFQWLFSVFPSDFCYWIANRWSRGSRAANNKSDEHFLGEDEWLWSYAKQIEKEEHFDFYVFGHRHLPLDLPVGDNSRYINLGDWIIYDTFAEFDGENLELKSYQNHFSGSRIR